MKKPLGIVLVAGLFACYALASLIAFIWALQNPDRLQSWARPGQNIDDIAFEIALFGPLRAGISAILAHGLWRLKDWARKGALGCIAIVLVRQIAVLTGVRKMASSSQILLNPKANYLALAALICSAVYLAASPVKAHFSKDPEEQ